MDRSRKILKPALLASLLGFPIGALADTLQVSNAAGCDDGTGNPYFCHIANAITAASDGDTIEIAAGSYEEQLSISKDVKLLGAGAGQTFLDGGGTLKPVTVNAGAVVQLNSLTVQDGGGSWGGGITVSVGGTLSIINCELRNNLAPSGTGGGAIASWGNLTIEGSRIDNNEAVGGGGAIYVVAGVTNVVSSLIDYNLASFGGAIFVYDGSAGITNSTVSNNAATGQGGALYKYDGAASFVSATVAGNASNTSEAGGIFSRVGVVTLQNTLLAGNTSSTGTWDCGIGDGASIASSGHNFIGTTTDCTVTTLPGAVGDILDQGFAAAHLDILADNGGPTRTRALLTGSAAIDAGDCGDPDPSVLDQRGEARSTDGDGDGTATCDIGAFEAAALDDGDDGDGDGGGGGGGGAADLLWLALLAAGPGARRRRLSA